MERFEVDFDNSKEICEGSDEKPDRARKAFVLTPEFFVVNNVVQLIRIISFRFHYEHSLVCGIVVSRPYAPRVC